MTSYQNDLDTYQNTFLLRGEWIQKLVSDWKEEGSPWPYALMEEYDDNILAESDDLEPIIISGHFDIEVAKVANLVDADATALRLIHTGQV